MCTTLVLLVVSTELDVVVAVVVVPVGVVVVFTVVVCVSGCPGKIVGVTFTGAGELLTVIAPFIEFGTLLMVLGGATAGAGADAAAEEVVVLVDSVAVGLAGVRLPCAGGAVEGVVAGAGIADGAGTADGGGDVSD